jgi:putative flippase GtrA
VASWQAMLHRVCTYDLARESCAPRSRKPSDIRVRLVKFAAVGASGVVVQAAALAVLLRVAPTHYLVDTAVAVEAAILHNFVWHRRWTWADRRETDLALELLRFNLTNGATSLAGNLILMLILVGGLRLNPLVANLITIAICSLVNFVLADRFVFIR